jgi:hypothetical protein
MEQRYRRRKFDRMPPAGAMPRISRPTSPFSAIVATSSRGLMNLCHTCTFGSGCQSPDILMTPSQLKSVRFTVS